MINSSSSTIFNAGYDCYDNEDKVLICQTAIESKGVVFQSPPYAIRLRVLI